MAYVQSFFLHLSTQIKKNTIYFTDCSLGHTETEKIIASNLSQIVHDEELYRKHNLIKVNFDVKEKRNKIEIRSIYFIKATGHVIKHPCKHVILLDGEEDTATQKRDGVVSMPFNDRTYEKSKMKNQKGRVCCAGIIGKVGAFILPHGTPTFLQMYAEEMSESNENISWKVMITGILIAVTSFFGVELIKLIFGLFIVASIDLLLSLIPGNVKKGQEKDHKIQAKLLAFASNFLMLLLFVKGGEYLRTFSKEVGFFGLVSAYIHYVVVFWIFSIYFIRCVKYAANANKTKVPKRIKKLFGKDVPS
ncbi:hypothetical protein [Paenibacillus popilliae]|uniref:Uncharacterized protein n=1 Tax=Paenibacillus popilliae ATCC 14706 TaxID=1212764 RepID=M9LLX7_PAEPP|nr:hypothetical protein [Paenibacillus popilliae]GAC44335.1 putative protein-S-isoprenylcysteine methyltransferase [Paenibacillus popilliae ATCC 14706]